MIPRIRSVDDVVEYIRKNDPESDVTKYVLKTLCERGAIKIYVVGNKKYVNLDECLAFFVSGSTAK
ncbi:MAG: hypothetical protein RR327_03700 [Clostridia bacterium]